MADLVTRVAPIRELKELFIETLLNRTNKVTKVSNDSVLNGVAYGNAKIAQKAMMEIALVESHLFPDGAHGQYLDNVADINGISPRFGAAPASTYVRLVGAPGTTYVAGTQTFTGNGITWDLQEDVTINALGYGYAKVQSQTSGISTNIDAIVITSVNPAPAGHLYVVNEYRAIGGRDAEDDRLFRLRIKHGANLAARGTLAHLTQVFHKLNNKILRVFYEGIDLEGKPIIALATVNGSDLTAAELDDLKARVEEFLSLRDMSLLGFNNPLITLKNADYFPIDISFRVQLNSSADIDKTRQEIQIDIAKYLDLRFWTPGAKVEWDDLLQIVKDHPKVDYVPDQFFTPNVDIETPLNQLPRVRGFLMLNMDGTLMSGESGILNPIYYPANPDFSFQATILQSI